MTVSETLQMALKIGGFGMTGIFIFMLFFWGIITVLVRIFPEKEDE